MPTPQPAARRGISAEKIIFAAVILWVAAVFIHYFSFPKVFELSFIHAAFSHPERMDGNKFLANGLESLKFLSLSFLILFSLWRSGRRGLYWLGLGLENIPLRFSMETALGILFFNGLWLGLGLNGLWFEPLLFALFFSFLAWSLWDFRGHFMKFQKMPRLEWPGWLALALAGLGLLFLGNSIVQGLLPEIYFDGLVYHLATLSFWKFHHGIANFYTNLYSYYPFEAELYYFNGFFLQGSEAAKTLNVFISALCALAAAGWAMEEAGTVYGCLAWAMVLFFPLVSATVWTTQNDVFLAFLFILFYYALFRWSQKEEVAWAVAAGIFGGAVLAVKYTAVIGVAGGWLALALTGRKFFANRRWGGWAAMLSLIGFSLAPWVFKNYAYTDNGFYPYFSRWLGGEALSTEKMAGLMNDHEAAFTGGFSPVGWIVRVLAGDLDKTIAPVLFSFFPFFFLPGPRRPSTKFLGVLSPILLAGGFLVSHQLRLMIPAFLIFFLLVVFTLADLRDKRWTFLWAWVLLLFGTLSFLSVCRLCVNYYHVDQVWLGKQTRQEYLAAPPQTASYIDLTRAAGELPPKDRLLIVGDSRSFYYPRSFYANSVFDDQVLETLARGEKDGEGIGKRLREMGIEDLVVSGQEGIRLAREYAYYDLSPDEWAKLDDFVQHHAELIYSKGLNGIYRVQVSRLERKSPIPNLLNILKTPVKGPEKVL